MKNLSRLKLKKEEVIKHAIKYYLIRTISEMLRRRAILFDIYARYWLEEVQQDFD